MKFKVKIQTPIDLTVIKLKSNIEIVKVFVFVIELNSRQASALSCLLLNDQTFLKAFLHFWTEKCISFRVQVHWPSQLPLNRKS